MEDYTKVSIWIVFVAYTIVLVFQLPENTQRIISGLSLGWLIGWVGLFVSDKLGGKS